MRIISFVIAIMIVTSLGLPALALPRADMVLPAIYFTGTTANCSVAISAYGKNINANLELWCNGNMIDSWNKSGQHSVTITGSHYGISGREYIVKVTGTIGNDSIVSYPVSAVCP